MADGLFAKYRRASTAGIFDKARRKVLVTLAANANVLLLLFGCRVGPEQVHHQLLKAIVNIFVIKWPRDGCNPPKKVGLGVGVRIAIKKVRTKQHQFFMTKTCRTRQVAHASHTVLIVRYLSPFPLTYAPLPFCGLAKGPRDTAVTAKHFVVERCSQGHKLKAAVESLPHNRPFLIHVRHFSQGLALRHKRPRPVQVLIPVDGAKLVVAAHEVHTMRKQNLECKQPCRELNRVRPSVDVVAQAQQARRRHVNPCRPECCLQKLKIFVVPVKVTHHVAWGLEAEKAGVLLHGVGGCLAQVGQASKKLAQRANVAVLVWTCPLVGRKRRTAPVMAVLVLGKHRQKIFKRVQHFNSNNAAGIRCLEFVGTPLCRQYLAGGDTDGAFEAKVGRGSGVEVKMLSNTAVPVQLVNGWVELLASCPSAWFEGKELVDTFNGPLVTGQKRRICCWVVQKWSSIGIGKMLSRFVGGALSLACRGRADCRLTVGTVVARTRRAAPRRFCRAGRYTRSCLCGGRTSIIHKHIHDNVW
eukprot:m.230621 g.230621  ORF g.230621 m.230621 type:complete len:526 (-) comp18859_c0_seq27:427-2004(-)